MNHEIRSTSWSHLTVTLAISCSNSCLYLLRKPSSTASGRFTNGATCKRQILLILQYLFSQVHFTNDYNMRTSEHIELIHYRILECDDDCVAHLFWYGMHFAFLLDDDLGLIFQWSQHDPLHQWVIRRLEHLGLCQIIAPNHSTKSPINHSKSYTKLTHSCHNSSAYSMENIHSKWMNVPFSHSTGLLVCTGLGLALTCTCCSKYSASLLDCLLIGRAINSVPGACFKTKII